jgi:quercetin 2,3-dioxygenase
MSAGTGIVHSEKNKNSDRLVKFLQIWVFPNKRNITPRYDQKYFSEEEKHNRLLTVVSPVGHAEGIQIQQNAWFSLGKLDKGTSLTYEVKQNGNGIYAFLLEGDVTINGVALNRRDGLGLTETDKLAIVADSDAELLLMDVPMS